MGTVPVAHLDLHSGVGRHEWSKPLPQSVEHPRRIDDVARPHLTCDAWCGAKGITIQQLDSAHPKKYEVLICDTPCSTYVLECSRGTTRSKAGPLQNEVMIKTRWEVMA